MASKVRFVDPGIIVQASGNGGGSSISASYALSASHAGFAISASYAVSASHEIIKEVSSSYADFALSSSHAITASYALNAGDSNWYNGGTFITSSVPIQVTGSVDVKSGNVNLGSNSYFFQGSNTSNGNVSLIGVNSSNQIYIGNQGYTNIIADDTNIEGDTQITGSLTISGSGLGSYTALNAYGNTTLGINGFGSSHTIYGNTTFTDAIQGNHNLTINGNTILGNAITDTIELKGHVTASGNISSSAISTASFGTYLGDGSQLTGIDSGSWDGQFTGNAEITGSLIISGAGANNLLDVGSGTSGKSRLIVTDNSAFYNTYINGELYLGQNGVTPQIHFGSDNIIYSMRRNGTQGLTIGNTEFNNGTDVSIYRNLEVGRDASNIGSNKLTVTGSATISGSTGLEVYGSGSTVFDVIGSVGTLFSVDDDLSGTLFTVNDISGLPVLEASASGEVYIGKSPQSLYTTAVISSTAAATTQSIFGLSTSSYDGAFFDYTVQSGSNARAGSIMSVWNGSTINFTETTTTDIGDTTDFNLIVHISQSQAQIASHATNAGYKIKTIIRSI